MSNFLRSQYLFDLRVKVASIAVMWSLQFRGYDQAYPTRQNISTYFEIILRLFEHYFDIVLPFF